MFRRDPAFPLPRSALLLPKKILGASLLGIECDEVIHSILDVMYAKAPYTVIQRAMHIHPTVSELVPTMLGSLRPLSASESVAAKSR